MKTIADLTRSEKIRLLKLLQAGDIDLKNVQPDTTIVSDPKEAFLSLMMAASQPEGVTLPIILVGEAKTQIVEFFKGFEGEKE